MTGLNQLQIDPERGIYDFGHAEVHELAHFFLTAYQLSVEQQSNQIRDEHAYGWL